MRALLLALAIGCGSSKADPPATPCSGAVIANVCVPALPACRGDEIVRAGACVRVGLTGCAPGFVADDAEGCRPVLPDAPCAAGDVAWLGETTCHPIVDCGSDRYGNPPTNNPILYVDATGSDTNDGSRDRPFKTINAALRKTGKHTIAIAEGTYDEKLVLDRDVDLWGRCPQKVTVAPTSGTSTYAITVVSSDVSIKRLGVAGGSGGVVAFNTTRATIEDSWLHDTGDAALGAQGTTEEGALLAKHVLVERARDFGVYALGGTVTIESSIVRATRAAAGNVRGYGVGAENSTTFKKPGGVVVRGSIVEKNREVNVFAIGGSAIVEGSLIRDGVLGADAGLGVWVTEDLDTRLPTSLRIADSVISGSVRSAVLAVGSTAEIVNTAMLHTIPSSKKADGGFCVFAERSKTTLTDSLCRDGREIGIEIAGGTASIARLALSDFTANDLGQGGIGLVSLPNKGPAVIDIVDTAVARVAEAGMLLGGGQFTIRGCAIRDVQPSGDGLGDGVDIAPWPVGPTWLEPTATIESTIVERVARAGMAAFGATTVSVRDVRLDCATLPLVASDRRGREETPLGPIASLSDGGGSYCGCGKEVRACVATVDSIAPVLPP